MVNGIVNPTGPYVLTTSGSIDASTIGPSTMNDTITAALGHPMCVIHKIENGYLLVAGGVPTAYGDLRKITIQYASTTQELGDLIASLSAKHKILNP